MIYRQAFDRLGNPVARPTRFAWLRRINESADPEGIYIIVGAVICVCIIGLWVYGSLP